MEGCPQGTILYYTTCLWNEILVHVGLRASKPLTSFSGKSRRTLLLLSVAWLLVGSRAARKWGSSTVTRVGWCWRPVGVGVDTIVTEGSRGRVSRGSSSSPRSWWTSLHSFSLDSAVPVL